MPIPKATEVKLSEEERTGLEQLVRRHNIGQQVALRGRIILTAGEGQTNSTIARNLKVSFSLSVQVHQVSASGRTPSKASCFLREYGSSPVQAANS